MESVCTGNRTVGSNPTLSATSRYAGLDEGWPMWIALPTGERGWPESKSELCSPPRSQRLANGTVDAVGKNPPATFGTCAGWISNNGPRHRRWHGQVPNAFEAGLPTVNVKTLPSPLLPGDKHPLTA